MMILPPTSIKLRNSVPIVINPDSCYYVILTYTFQTKVLATRATMSEAMANVDLLTTGGAINIYGITQI